MGSGAADRAGPDLGPKGDRMATDLEKRVWALEEELRDLRALLAPILAEQRARQAMPTRRRPDDVWEETAVQLHGD
jgi:hypothetical protein